MPKLENKLTAPEGLRTTALFATALVLMVNTERCMTEAKRRYNEDQLAIGHCMRLQRESDGVSLRALSRQMKLSAPYVSDLERGRRNWSPITMANYRHSLDSLANDQVLPVADTAAGSKKNDL